MSDASHSFNHTDRERPRGETRGEGVLAGLPLRPRPWPRWLMNVTACFGKRARTRSSVGRAWPARPDGASVRAARGRSGLPPSQEVDGNNSDLDPPSTIQITCARGGREAMASTRVSTDRSGAGGLGKSGLARVLQCPPLHESQSTWTCNGGSFQSVGRRNGRQEPV